MLKQQPRLSFWQIWNMSFGFLGIQFGYALQNANVSRIFETLGASIDTIPILWIAAPVTGLVVQPIIGHMSDNTWNRLGRRRPYFLIGAIFASIALIIMPNSPVLWVAAGMLWIMDASINVSMEPFRAFVGDMLPSEQRTKGFAMQSFFIGIGAVIASALPYVLTNWLNIPNVAAEGERIPPSVKFSFYIGAVVFFVAVLWTVIRTREYSPEELEAFQGGESEEEKTRNIESGEILPAQKFLKLQFITGFSVRAGKINNGFVVVINDLYRMPKAMAQLAVVQFFSWFALFAMWIYTTAAVTSHVYGTSDPKSFEYNQGADWVGIMFAVYNGFAALVAFSGGIGLISIYFVSNPNLLILSMLGVGLAWSSILSMPYAILTGSLPARKMGTYMGIFNFFIVIPQILAASILGFFVSFVAGGHAIYALILGGVSFFVAALFVLMVQDKDDPALAD